jgi:hypothetical protein
VQAGKDAFAAGLHDCPYPIDDDSCDEQRHLWLRGHALARYEARGASSDQTPAEMLEEYREAKARREFRDAFTEAFAKFMSGVDDRGYPDIVRDVVFEWLCDGATSQEDFVDEAESAANEHDWPEPDDEDEGEDE